MSETKDPTEADLDLIERAVAYARLYYARSETMPVTAILRTAAGRHPDHDDTVVVQDDGEGRDLFLDQIRYLSIKTGSPRAAVMAEVYGIEAGHEAAVTDLVEKGDLATAKPVTPSLLVVVESEDGATIATRPIRRHHAEMAEIGDGDAPVLHPWTGEPYKGEIANFHMRLAARIHPSTIAWVKKVDETYPIETVDAPDLGAADATVN